MKAYNNTMIRHDDGTLCVVQTDEKIPDTKHKQIGDAFRCCLDVDVVLEGSKDACSAHVMLDDKRVCDREYYVCGIVDVQKTKEFYKNNNIDITKELKPDYWVCITWTPPGFKIDIIKIPYNQK